MRIARIRAVNFANFADLDVETGDSVVVLGENKVGKSNLLYGLR
jgi:putative ATP-dependent endonuclease of the OLD family